MLGSRLGKNMKEVASMIQAFTSDEIASILDGSAKTVAYSAGEIDITAADIVVQRSEMANVKVLNEGSITVGFDTEITPELYNEGLARDIVRAVQTRRKDSGLEVSDHIRLTIAPAAEVAKAVEAFRSYIAGETLADELILADNSGETVSIDDLTFALTVEKV